MIFHSSSYPTKTLWIATFFLGAVFLLRAPIGGSFWLDETLTSWITNAGADEVWHRTVDFQGQSPFYYEILWLVRQVFGESEVALRVPSLLFAGCSLVYLARISSLLFCERAIAPIALSILICADGFQRAAISARPYALGIACVFGSIFYLLKFVKEQRLIDLALYSAFTVAAFYSHYLFATVLLLHLVVASSLRPRRRVLYAVLGTVLLGPGVVQLRDLLSRASELSFAQPVSASAFILSFAPLPIIVVVSVSIVLALIWGARWQAVKFEYYSILVLGVWIFSPVILFFAASALGGRSLLVSRYWVWQLGGVALALGVTIATISSQRARTIATSTLLAGLLFRLVTQQWQFEDWRSAAHLAEKDSATEIILFSGLIESESSWARNGPAIQEYLQAPLSVYGVTKVIRVVGLTEPSADLAKELIDGSLLVSFRIGRGPYRSPERFVDEATAKGLTVVPIAQGGLVSVYRFVASGSAG
jgi:hypothetical protein